MPIITWVASGAAAIIRLFGPESMGGMGDFGARTDAEVARTGLPVDDTAVDEIADEVLCSSHHIFFKWIDSCSIQRYIIIQKANSSKFLVSLLCMTTNFSRNWYDVYDLTESFLTNL